MNRRGSVPLLLAQIKRNGIRKFLGRGSPCRKGMVHEASGRGAYFQSPNPENPAYIEYRIGNFQAELGIIDKKYKPQTADMAGTGGATLCWHAEDVIGMLEVLKGLGVTEYAPLTERGVQWTTASVVDPFGNNIGLIHSPHYKDIWASTHPSESRFGRSNK
ncbi:VOC family protein [Cohnella sp. AR92]|uniref:VOC family protein n=1 Tax=Cohnella sp. AR92 TaxID=648716 RepID=UPI001EE107CD|nr:VOC family protein [Cohnella sp. AR92]